MSGKGLNNDDPSSLKNAGYIAEAQNDFIFAVIGEELGFTGSVITILLLFTIVIECIITAVRAKDQEGRLLCCGVAAYIAFQTFINIGVVSWILPNTGSFYLIPDFHCRFLAVELHLWLIFLQPWELYLMLICKEMLTGMMIYLLKISEDNISRSIRYGLLLLIR